MGQNVKIKLKTNVDSEIDKMNLILETMAIPNRFITEKMNMDWVDNINNDPLSPHAYLKPITLDELKQTFSYFTELGYIDFDIAFGRTSQEDVDLYALFIHENKDQIEYVKGGDELVKRYVLVPEHAETILNLNVEPEEPEKLPKDQQTKDDLQSGQYLCKSWGLEPFWIVFGNVDMPIFMKKKIYVDDLYNNLYKDKKGYSYMLFPLLPFDNDSLTKAYGWFDRAWDMGLRETANFILPILYGFDFANYDSVVNSYKEFYTQDEIIERFKTVFKMTTDLFPYNYPNGIVWRDNDKKFKAIGRNPTSLAQSRCSMLTCLIRSIEDKKIITEAMTMYTGKKYIPIEF